MRTRYVGVSGGVLSKDSCRGDGGGRSIHAKIGTVYKVMVTDMTLMYQSAPDTNYGTWLQNKISNSTGQLWMALIQTDLSAYAGKTVLAATLNLENVDNRTAKDFKCHEVWRLWDELQATYNDRLTGVPWEVAGCKGAGDRDSVHCDMIQIGSAGWYAWDVIIPVTAWLSGARTNYGVRLVVPVLSAVTHEFYTDDNGDPAKRPYWELTLA